MCDTCDREDALVELLKDAKTDRSKITDDVLDTLVEYIEDSQNERLDHLYG